MYLPLVQMSAEADWQLRRNVTDLAQTREASLLRKQSLRREVSMPKLRRRLRWHLFRPAASTRIGS